MTLSAALLSVVVEISPRDADAELTDALIAACSSSVPAGRCVLADSESGTTGGPAVAIVSWQTGDRVELVVGVRRRGRVAWLSQHLQFRPGDQPRERWRAVGLAVGTLVGEIQEASDRRSSDAESSANSDGRGAPDAQQPMKSHAAAEPASSAVWLDLGPTTGPALDEGAWRAGAFLRSSYQPPRFFAFGTMSASYAVRPSDQHGVTVGWATFAAGAGHTLLMLQARASVELRVDLFWQLVRVSALDPETGRSGSADGSLLGVRAGLDASWMIAPPLGLMLGAEVSRLSAALDVQSRGEPIGVAAATQYAFVGGARIRLR